MNTCVLLFFAAIINVILLYLIIRWYRNKLFTQYQNFLDKTDEILSGKRIDLSYDESLDSAISERLNRIMEISHIRISAIRSGLLLRISFYIQVCSKNGSVIQNRFNWQIK